MAKKQSKFAGLFDDRLDKMPAAADRNEGHLPAPLGRPRRGKRSNPDYRPVQVLLRKDTTKQARRILTDLDNGQDVSQLVQKLLEDWIAKHVST
jgi:hypothetical protein